MKCVIFRMFQGVEADACTLRFGTVMAATPATTQMSPIQAVSPRLSERK